MASVRYLEYANFTRQQHVQKQPIVDASFQFVDIWDLSTIDSLLKHTPHVVVNRVDFRRVRRFLLQQRFCVFVCWKTKTRFKMPHWCQEAASGSKRRPIDIQQEWVGRSESRCYYAPPPLIRVWCLSDVWRLFDVCRCRCENMVFSLFFFLSVTLRGRSAVR